MNRHELFFVYLACLQKWFEQIYEIFLFSIARVRFTVKFTPRIFNIDFVANIEGKWDPFKANDTGNNTVQLTQTAYDESEERAENV
jgi:hypothetical protein